MKMIEKSETNKGKMARELVYLCIRCMMLTLAWSVLIKTAALLLDRMIDLTDILTFTSVAFGGELLMLLAKRIFAKEQKQEDLSNEGIFEETDEP